MMRDIYSAAIECEPQPIACRGYLSSMVLLSSSIGGAYVLVFPEEGEDASLGTPERLVAMRANEVVEAVRDPHPVLVKEIELRRLGQEEASLYVVGRELGKSTCGLLMCGDSIVELVLRDERWVCRKAAPMLKHE